VKEIIDQLPWIWALLAIAFGICEILVPYFGFIFAALAALVAALCAAMHIKWELQVAIFSVVLLLSIFLLRPRLIKRLHATSRGVPSRTGVLFGKRGVVTEVGRAEIDGQDWAIQSNDVLESGASVEVIGADGIVLMVRKV
jgi:membrane protein implicated in regulation of membrane protease activity